MYPLKKGRIASQAHVGLPEGTYEEEHGRKGFYGKIGAPLPCASAHRLDTLRRQAAAALLRPERIEALRPLGSLGMPAAFIGNSDVRLYVSRRSEPMPYLLPQRGRRRALLRPPR